MESFARPQGIKHPVEMKKRRPLSIDIDSDEIIPIGNDVTVETPPYVSRIMDKLDVEITGDDREAIIAAKWTNKSLLGDGFRYHSKNCVMETKIYRHNDELLKFNRIIINKNNPNKPDCLFRIAKEIYIQNYVYDAIEISLSNGIDPGFRVPKITSYGSVRFTDGEKWHYIRMPFITHDNTHNINLEKKSEEISEYLLQELKICHNDFKPANIIVETDGTVNLIDWGEGTYDCYDKEFLSQVQSPFNTFVGGKGGRKYKNKKEKTRGRKTRGRKTRGRKTRGRKTRGRKTRGRK